MQEQPDRVNAAVADFIARLPPAAPPPATPPPPPAFAPVSAV